MPRLTLICLEWLRMGSGYEESKMTLGKDPFWDTTFPETTDTLLHLGFC